MNDKIRGSEKVSGYQYLIDSLSRWGVCKYAGVTGGGVVHFLKYINPFINMESNPSENTLLTIDEYSAGFFPIGHYLATGKIAAAIATTGAASKLLGCGLSDAKLHNIPSVYILPLSAIDAYGKAPLQDTSEFGSNIVHQLRSELPDSVFVLDTPEHLPSQLEKAHYQLKKSKPVVFFWFIVR
ncbi:thiamine pyrophosphate-binding protein [Samsonia erythrinae]|uniref:Thiamine pyrophosphate-dependent enzyme n=1 Tax=Samsonia erythrinae TaxID=160434 RepID=A0A4R3VF60_9GAMM|nr:thiamine pyrophosphate-binding protein [Samsonia erythrinae]TCV04056.1 thiamine pyrophosphate-dependent enzyme [Samsonia erythrinae]